MEYTTAYILVCAAAAATVAIITAMTTALILNRRHERELREVRGISDYYQREAKTARTRLAETRKELKEAEATLTELEPAKRASTPLQEKLNAMVNATGRRRSPIRHAPNIQPRPADVPPTWTDNLNGAVLGAVVASSTVTNHTDLRITDPTPTPDSGNHSSGTTGSFDSSSDSGSCGGGGE